MIQLLEKYFLVYTILCTAVCQIPGLNVIVASRVPAFGISFQARSLTLFIFYSLNLFYDRLPVCSG